MAEFMHCHVRADGIAVLTLDQAEARVNVLSSGCFQSLERNLTLLAHQGNVRGLVLASGKPGNFIAGADLHLLQQAPAPQDPAVRAFINQGLVVADLLARFPAPTCAVIEGAALGGGLEMTLACDLRLVSPHPKVQLGLPEVKLGLIPGWGGTQRLPRIIGLGPALTMIMTGASWNGDASVQHGLAERISESDTIAAACARLAEYATQDWQAAREVRNGPIPLDQRGDLPALPAEATPAIQTAYEVITQGADLPLSEAIPRETEAFMCLAGSPESRAAIEAFFVQRKRS